MSLIPQLHLIRLGGPDNTRYEPISREEWRQAIEDTQGVRLVQGGALAPNLKTGTATNLWKQIPCDAEVAVIGTGGTPTWIPLFSWQDSGSAVINQVFDPSDPEDPRTAALFAVAQAVGARVADDKGALLEPPLEP